MKATGQPHMYSVLFVEDDPTYFARTAKMLSKLGFFLYVAENGQEGLRIFHEINPDIVITGIEMPFMNGLDMALQMRNCSESTPIILTLSAHETEYLMRSFEIGIDHYLLKPISPETLEATLLRCTKKLENARLLEDQVNQSSLLLNVMEQSPSIITITDPSGSIQYVNSLGAAASGLNQKDLLGKHVSILFHHNSADIFNGFSEALMTGQSWAGELIIRDNKGNILLEQTSVSPVLDAEGAVSHFILFSEDITKKREAEEEIRKLNAELEYRVLRRTALLEATNRELDEFCDAISHELCGPLSRLQGLSKALCEDLKDTLDDSGKDYLNRMNQTSHQLKNIIDTLLNLSQLTRRGLSVQDVNLSALALSITNNLKSINPERDVKFYIAPNIVVKGDQVLLKVVLENLLMNAWKSTENHSPSQIEFGIAKSNGKSVYFVRDNGCGFDMKYANKLFKLFYRLSAPHDSPVNGTELATAQRIIQRHGGRIWAEGEVEKGATFYFTL